MTEYISWDQMLEAYSDCVKHKRGTETCQEFDICALKNLYKLWLELNSGKYIISSSIAFVVHYPGEREVFAAAFRDRIVHHLIILYFNEQLEIFFIHNAYQCRKGKGTLCAVKSLQQQLRIATNNFTEKAYVLQGDLKNFFCSINKNILYILIEKTIKSFNLKNTEFYLNLIKQIIFDNPQEHCIRRQDISQWKNLKPEKSLFNVNLLFGLPVGNLTSQKFAAILLTFFDRFILSNFLFYGRYVDDFFIIDKNKKKLEKFITIINIWLKENLQLELSFKKTKIKTTNDAIVFVGKVVKQNAIFIHRRVIATFKRKMNKFYKIFCKKQFLTFEECRYICTIANCYIGMLHNANQYRKRKKLMTSLDIFWTNMFMYPDKKYSKFILLPIFK